MIHLLYTTMPKYTLKEKTAKMQNKTRKTIDHIILFFARGFGSGCIPIAPGTMGTLASIPFYYFIQKFSLTFYLILLILTFTVGVWLCDKASKLLHSLDPPSVVWDEM